MRNRIFVLIAFTLLVSCAESGSIEAADIIACGAYDSSTHLCDRRDGNLYKFVKMPGGKFWMAENLKYEMPGGKSKCYGDEPENCKIYGRLYSWRDREELCPKGWRMPDMKTDWEVLEEEVGSFIDEQLKAASGWDAYDGGKKADGTDDFGFAALPGGAYGVMPANGIASEELCRTLHGDNEGHYSDWGGIGKIAVFMSLSLGNKWVISNNPAGAEFCLAADAYTSVRCVQF